MVVTRGLEGHVAIWNDEGGVCLSLLRGREPCQHLMSPWLGFEEWESGNRSKTDWRGEPAGRAAFLKADVKSEVAAFRTEITPQQEKSLDGISCQWKGAGREEGQRHHLGFLPEGCVAWPGRVDVTHGGSGCQCLVLMSCCWNLYMVKMSAGIKIGEFWRAVNEALKSTFRRGQEEEGAEAPGWYLLPMCEATGRMVLASGDMWGPCRVGAALPLPWELWGRWTSESPDVLVARGEC